MVIHMCAFVCESLFACIELGLSLQACDRVFLVEHSLNGAKSQCLPVVFGLACLSAGLSLHYMFSMM